MNLSCKRPRLTEKWNARRIKSTLAFSSYPQAHSPAEGPPSALQHACPYRPHTSSARERVMTLLMGLRLLETRDPPGWSQPRPSPLLSARLGVSSAPFPMGVLREDLSIMLCPACPAPEGAPQELRVPASSQALPLPRAFPKAPAVLHLEPAPVLLPCPPPPPILWLQVQPTSC